MTPDTPPPPPTFTKDDTPPSVVEHATQTPNADKLMEQGGRVFFSGTLWVARLNKQQETGKTEEEAAGRLLDKIV